MTLGEFKPIGRSIPSNDYLRTSEKAVEASAHRMQLVAQKFEVGIYSSWNLSPRKQELGTTCFFSGPIQIAIESGRNVSEQQIEQAARAMGLLNDGGAITYDPQRRDLMERFVYEQTGVRIRYDQPKMPEGKPQEVDVRLIKCVIEDGNMANLLYPLAQFDRSGRWNGRGEWATVFSIEKTPDDLIWRMTSFPAGVIEILNTKEMAKRLYSVQGGHPEIWAIEIQTHYPEKNIADSVIFRPKKK